MQNKITLALTKDDLQTILHEIIDPFYNQMHKDEQISQFFPSQDMLYTLKHKQTLLAYRFFTKSSQSLDEQINFAGKAHERIGLGKQVLYDYGLKMTKLYRQWLKEHKKLSEQQMDTWDKKLSEFMMLLMHDYDDSKNEQEMFLDIDEGLSDDDINQMHYDEQEKKDARSFMAGGAILDDEIEEIQTLLEDLHDHIEESSNVNAGLIEEFNAVFQKIAKFFALSGEFKDMAYPFDNLGYLLNNLDFDALDGATQQMTYNFLKTIYEDLSNWVSEVLVEQSARDIHYLDASLLANISQIEIMLTDQPDDDDEDFMF